MGESEGGEEGGEWERRRGREGGREGGRDGEGQGGQGGAETAGDAKEVVRKNLSHPHPLLSVFLNLGNADWQDLKEAVRKVVKPSER